MGIFIQRVVNKIWPATLQKVAVSQRILAPAAESSAPASFYLPGEFEAVVKCVNDDRELEWKRVSGAPQPNFATVEYVIENAWMIGDALTSGRFLQRFKTNRPSIKKNTDDRPVYMPEAVLSTNVLSGLEFGHWVRDALVTELHGVAEGVPSVAFAREPWPHEPGFRDITGLQCSSAFSFRIERLRILDDRGHTPHWEDRFRLLRLNAQSGQAHVAQGTSAGALVFLRRGANARMREARNIEAVEVALAALGFTAIDPSSMSVPEIASALRDAKIVVGTEGSNLNHIHFFAPDGVALVCLQDPFRFNAWHKGLMDCYGGRFAFVVGRPIADAPDRNDLNVDDLKRTIDLIR